MDWTTRVRRSLAAAGHVLRAAGPLARRTAVRALTGRVGSRALAGARPAEQSAVPRPLRARVDGRTASRAIHSESLRHALNRRAPMPPAGQAPTIARDGADSRAVGALDWTGRADGSELAETTGEAAIGTELGRVHRGTRAGSTRPTPGARSATPDRGVAQPARLLSPAQAIKIS